MKAVATVVMNRVNAATGEYARISQRWKYKKYNISRKTI